MEGDVNLFKEMHRVRTGGGEIEELAETGDCSTGEDEIANTFSNICNTLYNSAESSEEMVLLQKKI